MEAARIGTQKPDRVSECSAECECIGGHAVVEEFNFESVFRNGAALADQLVEPVLHNDAHSTSIDIGAAFVVGRGAVV